MGGTIERLSDRDGVELSFELPMKVGDEGERRPNWVAAAKKCPTVIVKKCRRPNGSKKRPGVVAKVLETLETGASQAVACAAAGIAPTTWNKWRILDEDIAALEEMAISIGLATSFSVVHTSKDWRAHTWMLERHEKTRDTVRRSEHSSPSVAIQINVPRDNVGTP